MASNRKNAPFRLGKGRMPCIEEIALILFFAGNSIEYFVERFFILFGLSTLSPFALVIIHLVTLAGIVAGFLKLERRLQLGCLAFLFLVVSLIAVNYLMNPELGEWLKDETYGVGKVFGLTGHIFAGGIVGFCVMIIQKDPDRILRCLKTSSYILLGYLLMMLFHRLRNGYFLVAGADGLRQTGYNMGFGYYCTYVSMLYYVLWKDGNRKLNLAVSALFAAFAVCFGSRGVIVSFAFFAASVIWTSLQDSKLSKRVFIMISLAIAASLCVVFYVDIVQGIQQALASFGITNSRTVSLLASSEDLLDSNGRTGVWSVGMSLIKENFPLGYGAFGERIPVGNYVRWGYLHNVILEIVVEFGLAGVILLVVLICKSASLINCELAPKWHSLFVLFFANCGMLLVSNSFWYFPYFWAAIAVGVLYGKAIREARSSGLQTERFQKGVQHV